MSKGELKSKTVVAAIGVQDKLPTDIAFVLVTFMLGKDHPDIAFCSALDRDTTLSVLKALVHQMEAGLN